MYRLFIAVFLAGSLGVYGQKSTVKNLPDYDDHWLHFGFSLAANQANFAVTPIKDLSSRDTVLTIIPSPKWGFNLSIVSDLRLHKYLTLRFLPALSFQDRFLNYSLIIDNAGNPDTVTYEKSVESTTIEFPFDLKLRSSRLNNLSAYMVGGVKYMIDLASQQDVKNSSNPKDQIIKLKKHDYAFEAGFGLDYYFPYFKFSTEIKACWGMRDLLIKENDSFSSSIDKLNSRLILLTLHFEG